jgi:transposase
VRDRVRRWLALDAEAKELEELIEALVRSTAPQLLEQFGIGVDTAAEILIVAGDNPERIHSEAAFAKLAGIAPVPTGSGMSSGKHRINHGGHRQLNAAIYRTVIMRMRFHEPTIAYVARRTAEGRSKRDIIRCLKRYVIREVYHLVKGHPTTGEIGS